jgi:flagellin
VYTFQTTLTAGNGNVWLGNNETAALSNLAAAINATAGGSGIAYGAGTTANTSVKSTASGATTVAVGALLNGTAGNNIAYSSTGTIAVTGADLTGGTAGTGVTVGGTAYQFVAVLSTTAVANEVVATTIQSGLTNLKAAVNGSGGAGYSSITAQNANVTATTATPTTSLAFSAITPGAAGNFISTVGSAFGAWTTVNFAGGANAGAAPVAVAGNSVTVGTQTYNFVTALSTTPTANEVLVGVTEAASIANLANAINGGSGSGVTYGSPTTANTSATAVAGTNAAGTLSTLTLTALTKGLTGNAISTSEVGAANTFANSVLSGGTAGSVNDLLTAQDAQSALSLIDNAVATVAALRGNIGSTVNRLQSASNVINNQTQNLTSAENDVTAADIPTAVAKLSQYSILMQTGISALAQANQQSQLVLKLLQ